MRLPRRRPEVVPAPVWRRVVAQLIDMWPLALMPPALVGSVLATVGVVKLRSWWAGEEPDLEWDDEDEDGPEMLPSDSAAVPDDALPMTATQRRWMEWFSSWQWRTAALVWSAISAVRGRNRRSRGARVMEIRRVDARTGGPVTVRSALIEFAARTAWRQVGQRVVGRPRLTAEPPVDLQSLPAADRRRAIDEHGSRIQRSCLAWLARALVFANVPSVSVVWTVRRQSIPHWLAGIVVVSDDS